MLCAPVTLCATVTGLEAKGTKGFMHVTLKFSGAKSSRHQENVSNGQCKPDPGRVRMHATGPHLSTVVAGHWLNIRNSNSSSTALYSGVHQCRGVCRCLRGSLGHLRARRSARSRLQFRADANLGNGRRRLLCVSWCVLLRSQGYQDYGFWAREHQLFQGFLY